MPSFDQSKHCCVHGGTGRDNEQRPDRAAGRLSSNIAELDLRVEDRQIFGLSITGCNRSGWYSITDSQQKEGSFLGI